MKRKFLSLPFMLLCAITLIIASCSKNGATGPAGPAGPAGTQGSAGNAGPTGAVGAANVIYSSWLNVTFSGSDSTGWSAQIPAPKLVDSILNKGSIKVYFNAGSDSANSNVVLPLPLDGYLVNVVAEVYYSPQLITIIASSDLSSFTDNGNHHSQFRYVLIPGGVPAVATSINGKKNGIDWNDYSQVKAYLGLKD